MSIAALLLASALAQADVPRVSEIIEVRVTNVDVVVTDKDGKRVHGLKKEDFEIVEGGKPQEITNLSEIRIEDHADSSTATVPALSVVPPKHIVIFYDCTSTTPPQRQRASKALSGLVSDLRPGDDAMVVSWNRRLKIYARPTNDRAALEAALQDAAKELSLGASKRLTMFDDLGAPGGSAATRAATTMERRRQIREETSNLIESVRGLEGILTRLAGLDGRKALVLISTAFSFRPGMEDVDGNEADALLWLENIDAPDMLKALTAAANAAGVSIYTMHASGLDGGMSVTDSSPAESLGRIRAAGANIDGLTYLAARTGGLVAANTNYFGRAVERIQEDLSSYYSIGYRASVARRDAERPIEVRTKNRTYSVRARHSLVERSFETELTDRVLAALFFPAASNDLGISAQILKTDWKGKKRVTIPVDVKIPMASLAFSPEGDGLVADLAIFVASADSTGSVSQVQRYTRRVPVKREQLATIAEKAYTYGMDVDLRTATAGNRLAIAVIDNTSKAAGLVTIDVKP